MLLEAPPGAQTQRFPVKFQPGLSVSVQLQFLWFLLLSCRIWLCPQIMFGRTSSRSCPALLELLVAVLGAHQGQYLPPIPNRKLQAAPACRECGMLNREMLEWCCRTFLPSREELLPLESSRTAPGEMGFGFSREGRRVVLAGAAALSPTSLPALIGFCDPNNPNCSTSCGHADDVISEGRKRYFAFVLQQNPN